MARIGRLLEAKQWRAQIELRNRRMAGNEYYNERRVVSPRAKGIRMRSDTKRTRLKVFSTSANRCHRSSQRLSGPAASAVLRR